MIITYGFLVDKQGNNIYNIIYIYIYNIYNNIYIVNNI